MTAPADLHDRLAARLLGVDVDADPVVVRAAFRRQARAVHPDTAVADACVDLGRLAAATPAVSPVGAAVPRRRSAPAGRLGLLVDLAG